MVSSLFRVVMSWKVCRNDLISPLPEPSQRLIRVEPSHFSKEFAKAVVMKWFMAGIEDDMTPKLTSIKLPAMKPIPFPVPVSTNQYEDGIHI